MPSSSFRGLLSRVVLLSLLSLAAVRAARADGVDDYLKTRMVREHIPCLSLVILRGGRIIKAKGYGKANFEFNAAATPGTVYDLASTTKPFVATAVLLLIQDGKLSLNDKIGLFIANAPDEWKQITVRHLLSHTSGIPDYLADVQKDFPHDAPPERIIEAAMTVPLKFAPGKKWSYSNTGFVLLGIIVKKVSGKTYDALLQERVFGPFGMKETQRCQPDGLIRRRASGYLWYGGAFHNVDFLRYMMTNHGDRGLLSTALDLAKWDAALWGDRLLTPATKKAMTTPLIQFDGGYSYPFQYGLGWFIKDINGHRQISHPGGGPGIGAIYSRYPDDDLTVILLANGGNAFMQALDIGVARHYISGLMKAKIAAISSAKLDSYAGYYNAFGMQILRVRREKSGLLIEDGGGINNEFSPLSKTDFIAEEADRGFSVTQNAQGEATGGTIRFGNGQSVVQRIGPFTGAVKPQSDPDPALTKKIEAVLQAFAQGGKAVEDVPQLAPQARKDYANGPAPELSGIQRISYLAAQDITAQNIERHGAKADRVLYYKLHANGGTRFVLIWLTVDNLLTDQDVVER